MVETTPDIVFIGHTVKRNLQTAWKEAVGVASKLQLLKLVVAYSNGHSTGGIEGDKKIKNSMSFLLYSKLVASLVYMRNCLKKEGRIEERRKGRERWKGGREREGREGGSEGGREGSVTLFCIFYNHSFILLPYSISGI